MELAKLMYKYRNRLINSDALINALKKLDYSFYDKNKINELLSEIKKIKRTTPNEIDEYEKNRNALRDEIADAFKMINMDEVDKDAYAMLEKAKNAIEPKKEIRDGGLLYESIHNVLINNPLVIDELEGMDDYELLEFITEYIYMPFPLSITKETFENLVKIAISKDAREDLWRLAYNYNFKDTNFNPIFDYFIKVRDDYYLLELICVIEENIDLEKIKKKVFATKDKDFIYKVGSRAKSLGYIEDEEIQKIKKQLEEEEY